MSHKTHNLPPRDLNELAGKINLVHFLQEEGYTIDPSKGLNGRVIVLKKPEKDETLLLSRASKSGNAIDMYSNANDGRDKGNVYHFLRNRGYEWKEVFEKLDRYLGQVPNNYQELRQQPLTPTPNPKKTPEQNLADVREGLVKNAMGLLPLTNTTYLQRRGISAETLEAPEFKNRIYNTHKEHQGQTYVNTEFPIRNQYGITNAIIRNEKFNGFHAAPKFGGAWISQTKHQQGPVDALVVTESPIDSLSYHQLKNPSANGQKVVHFATGGRLDAEQAKFLQEVINHTSAQKLVLANDHDTAGIRQNINIVGAIHQPNNECSQNITVTLDNPERLQRVLRVQAVHETAQVAEKYGQDLQNLLKTLNKEDIEGQEPTASLRSTKQTSLLTEYELSYKGGSQADKRVQRAVIAMKGLEDFVRVELPLEKDYNEQLQQKNLKKQYYQIEVVGENTDKTRTYQRGFEHMGEALHAFREAHEAFRHHTHYVELKGLVPNEKGKTGTTMEVLAVSGFDHEKNRRFGEIDEEFDKLADKQLKNNPALGITPAFACPAETTLIKRGYDFSDVGFNKDTSTWGIKPPSEQGMLSKPLNNRDLGLG